MRLFSLFAFNKFYPLEKKILDILAENSPDNIRPLLLERIKEINLIQRHADFKEINLYAMKGKKVVKNPSIRMPIDIEEYKYSSITMQIDNEIFKVDTWVVNGTLFSLTFNRSPKKYIKRIDLIVLSIKVNYPVPSLKTAHSVANKEILDFYLCQMDTKVPEDYLNILLKSDGIVINNWNILSIEKVKHISLQDGGYYVLAESSDDRYLMVKERSQDGKIYFTTHDSDEIVDMGNSIRLAVDKLSENIKDCGEER